MGSNPQALFTPNNLTGQGFYPILPSWLAMIHGNIWYVRPAKGSDVGNTGRTPDQAFKTLKHAHGIASPNQNDVIVFIGEGNSADLSSDRQQTTLTWSKDLVHLIGVNSGSLVSQRARISFVAGFVGAANLMTVSANGCYFANFQLFEGVASANPTGCLRVAGDRNVFENVHIAGIGNDANDIAGAYSLFLDGANENVFRKCAIGLDTIGAGTAENSEILVDAGSARNLFEDCLIFRMLDHTSNHPLVKLADATAIDRFLWFKKCLFLNMSVNYAIAQTGVFKLVEALTQGFIIVELCHANPGDNSSTVKWDVDDRNQISLFATPLPIGDTAGTPLEV